MKSRLMANGMTTGTIGATAEKDKTRSSVLLVRIQISGNLQKKNNNNNNETKHICTFPHHNTACRKINTIHTDECYYRYREPT